MSRKRRQYTPAYRHEAARLVIDTGRPIVQVAREIGVGERYWDAGWLRNGPAATVRRAWSMLMNGPSWNGSGSRTLSCGWTGSS